MSRKAFNKKYLTLSNVRVAYRPKDDTIHLTSTDRDLAGEGFRLTLKPGTETDQILRELLYEKGLINQELNTDGLLPTVASLKLDASTPWYSIAIGEGVEDQISVDARTNPNVIIAGPTGGGKSVMQRNLIHHCLTHNDQWAVYGVDLTGVELKPYLKYETTVREITTSVGDTLLMFLKLQSEMYRRYALMEKHGINNLLDLDAKDSEAGDTKALMIIVDEATALFRDENTMDTKARDMIREVTESIVRLGRAARIHVVLSTQRIADAGIPRTIDNCAVKITCGALDSEASSLLFGDDSATRIPKIRGRGLIRVGNEPQAFQSYYSAPTSGEEWVLEHGKTAEPELYKKLLLES
jgi:DNA segregation ATPase FtsK/SpoIIIE-like protein